MEQSKKGFGRKICALIDLTNSWAARIFSYLVIVMMLTISYEVVSRYLFNAPTDWSGEINQYLLCAMSMLGGGYTLLVDQHVRVDIVYRYFSARQRAIIELATWWLLIILCLILIWKGGVAALDALIQGKKSMSILEFPLFPSLVMVPLGAFLLLLQAAARIIRNILSLKTGQEEVGHGKSLFS